MITFADIALPVFCALVIAVIFAAVAWLCHVHWQAGFLARRNRHRIRGDAQVRELRRLAWYKLTRRMQGRCPQLPNTLSTDEAITFGKLAGLYRQRGVWAEDPQRAHRYQQ